MSASECNGYKWQTNINNDDDKTRVDISWADYFVMEVHEAGHFFSPVGPYQSRLKDGFICVVYYSKFKQNSKNKRVYFTIQVNILFGKGCVQR
jgi:hypothetical protein